MTLGRGRGGDESGYILLSSYLVLAVVGDAIVPPTVAPSSSRPCVAHDAADGWVTKERDFSSWQTTHRGIKQQGFCDKRMITRRQGITVGYAAGSPNSVQWQFSRLFTSDVRHPPAALHVVWFVSDVVIILCVGVAWNSGCSKSHGVTCHQAASVLLNFSMRWDFVVTPRVECSAPRC